MLRYVCNNKTYMLFFNGKNDDLVVRNNHWKMLSTVQLRAHHNALLCYFYSKCSKNNIKLWDALSLHLRYKWVILTFLLVTLFCFFSSMTFPSDSSSAWPVPYKPLAKTPIDSQKQSAAKSVQKAIWSSPLHWASTGLYACGWVKTLILRKCCDLKTAGILCYLSEITAVICNLLPWLIHSYFWGDFSLIHLSFSNNPALNPCSTKSTGKFPWTSTETGFLCFSSWFIWVAMEIFGWQIYVETERHLNFKSSL